MNQPLMQTDDDEAIEFELVESELDDLTHQELRLLYNESAESIRFAKAQQWKSLGATLAVFVVLGLCARSNLEFGLFQKFLGCVSLLLSVGVIYSLIVYQVWQNTERQKLDSICEHFSNLTAQIRALKSTREANFFRYLLLTFMIVTIVLANLIVLVDISNLPVIPLIE